MNPVFDFPIGKFWSKWPKNRKNRGNRENREILRNFNFFYFIKFLSLKCTFCPNFMEKHWFLRKLEHFQSVWFFIRIWPEFDFRHEWSLHKKGYRNWSECARDLTFSQNVSNRLNLKVRKIGAPATPQIFFISTFR